MYIDMLNYILVPFSFHDAFQRDSTLLEAMEQCAGNFRKVNSRLMRARAALLQADVQTALVSIQKVG